MDKFIVSARKYRPQTFDTVVGQSHITTTLRNAIRNRQLAHAFLFCGPRGVGKTTCARILAKTINCETPRKDGEACDQCNSCRSFNEGTSLNIHELDAASNNSVDDIRSLVEQVRFAPQAGKYKVYIIDEVHMLSSSAFNAFLKTLEEPPEYAIFILATTEKHKILPTILSRCQIFDFKRITIQDTVDHLQEICDKENIKADKAALQVIAQKSEGCMRDALSIMDKIVSFTNGEINYSHTLEHLNILDADYYFRMLECMQRQDLAGAMLLYDDINRKGFEGDIVLDGFSEFMRNLLVCQDDKVAHLLEVVDSFRDRYIKAAGVTGTAWIISALNLLNEAAIQFKMARNKRLHVELVLIKLTYLNQALDVVRTEGGMSAGKKTELAKPVGFRRIAPRLQAPGNKASKKAPVTEGARIVVEDIPEKHEPVREEQPSRQQTIPEKKKPARSPKLSKLENIRREVASKQASQTDEELIPLDEETLRRHWDGFTDKLKSEKNPAAQSFSHARLTITGPSSFDVITNNNLEQKFIEQERIALAELLQQVFCNKFLQYNILIDENVADVEPTDRPLNTREQFQQLAEAYPLVKELKDRLRLELDY